MWHKGPWSLRYILYFIFVFVGFRLFEGAFIEEVFFVNFILFFSAIFLSMFPFLKRGKRLFNTFSVALNFWRGRFHPWIFVIFDSPICISRERAECLFSPLFSVYFSGIFFSKKTEGKFKVINQSYRWKLSILSAIAYIASRTIECYKYWWHR